MDIQKVSMRIHEINARHGWNDITKKDWKNKYKIPTKLALIMSEVSEALEGFRNDDIGNFSEELADIVIRTLHLAYMLDINMSGEIDDKCRINSARSLRHGGKKV